MVRRERLGWGQKARAHARALPVWLVALWWLGCAPTGGGRSQCAPGQIGECVCLETGARGEQICQANSRFGACVCGADAGLGVDAAADGQPPQDGGTADAAPEAGPRDGGPDACTPACAGRACGDDGCGGVCGACDDGQVCQPDGQCAAAMAGPPQILSLAAEPGRITEGGAALITAVVTDPEGNADVVGGVLSFGVTPLGAFEAAGQGRWTLTVGWADIDAVQPVQFDGELRLRLRATFRDQAGAEAQETLDLLLHCDDAGGAACGGACADLATSADHCGACGTPCADDCQQGLCVCAAGSRRCDGVCRAVGSDPSHCGGCDVACPDAEGGAPACVDGVCQDPCAARGQVACDGRCVDLQADVAHCGGCGVACPDAEGGAPACVGGACQDPCAAQGQVACDGRCVDPRSDVAHCGGCGVACPAADGGAAACVDGVCQDPCAAGGRVACDGQCVDPQFDVRHCGGCGVACPQAIGGLAACLGGACQDPCAAGGRTNCAGVCVDTDASAVHCGACGNACPEFGGVPGRCVEGACEDPCLASGRVACGGVCVDVQTSGAHCGGCGNVCAAPPGGAAQCVDGACERTCPQGTRLCGDACVACPEGGVAATTCDGGACVATACEPGRTLCGGACAVCPGAPAVQTACDGQACVATACADGFLPCDGACAACPGAPASAFACDGGACVAAGCDGDFRACDGACAPCPTARVTATACDGAACVAATCEAGFLACEGACRSCPQEGVAAVACEGAECVPAACEADHLRCGDACSACPQDAQAEAFECVQGACQVSACAQGALACGGRCAACPVAGVLTAGCQGDACVPTACEAGFKPCGDACVACPQGVDPADGICFDGACVASVCPEGSQPVGQGCSPWIVWRSAPGYAVVASMVTFEDYAQLVYGYPNDRFSAIDSAYWARNGQLFERVFDRDGRWDPMPRVATDSFTDRLARLFSGEQLPDGRGVVYRYRAWLGNSWGEPYTQFFQGVEGVSGDVAVMNPQTRLVAVVMRTPALSWMLIEPNRGNPRAIGPATARDARIAAEPGGAGTYVVWRDPTLLSVTAGRADFMGFSPLGVVPADPTQPLEIVVPQVDRPVLAQRLADGSLTLYRWLGDRWVSEPVPDVTANPGLALFQDPSGDLGPCVGTDERLLVLLRQAAGAWARLVVSGEAGAHHCDVAVNSAGRRFVAWLSATGEPVMAR